MDTDMLYTMRCNGDITSQHTTEDQALLALYERNIPSVNTSDNPDIRYTANDNQGNAYTITIEPANQPPPTPKPIQPQPDITLPPPKQPRYKPPIAPTATTENYDDLVYKGYASCLNIVLVIICIVILAGWYGSTIH